MYLSSLQLKKTKANSLHVQKQFDHETRKKEREFSKLKERIHQLLTDKNQEKKVGLDILNLINRPAGGQRAMWKTGSAKYVHVHVYLQCSFTCSLTNFYCQ